MSRPQERNSQDADQPVIYTDADYEPWLEQESARLDSTIRLFTLWYWDHVYRQRAYGVERLPDEGAYLLVPNHSSYTDPFLQARPQRRHMRFMAKSTMFKNPLVAAFMRAGGGFPVNRGAGD
ncbi:MAG: lysophospholipid acyltransferase family protein, partial [Gaiellales bacterium]